MTLFPATREFFRLALHSFPAGHRCLNRDWVEPDSEKPEGLLEGLVGR